MALEPFQRLILGDYFAGSRETVAILPKKNGKSTLLAALALYHLLSTADAEVVVAAASREQAMILYDAAVGFVRRSDFLPRHVKAQAGYRMIRNLHNAGRIRVLAADVDTADGVRPTLALVDELHRHRSAALYGVFRDGLQPRDGRMVTISTAGEHVSSPLGQMRESARQLTDRKRRGAHLYARSPDRAFVLHEWSLDDDEDLSPKAAKRCNPASWQTVALLRERKESPSTRPDQWARYACGLWVSAQSFWLDADDWNAAASDERLRAGDRVALGFDGARMHDATALIACRLSDGLIEPLRIWESPNDGRDWRTPAGEVDAAVSDAFERYTVARLYADPPLWQSEIDQWAQDFGSAVMRYATARGRMFDAVERFRTDLAAGRVSHTGDSVLTRHALNAQMEPKRSGYWLVKPGSGPADKIDAAVAAVLAWEARADELSAAPSTPGQLLTF